MSSLSLTSLTAFLLFSLTSPAIQGTPTDRPVAVVPAPRTDEGGARRQAECLRRVRESEPTKVVFLGDSITEAWEHAGASVWKEHIAPFGALEIGVGGDRTEHVLWRLAEAPLTRLEPRAIVLMIGTNNLGHGSSNAEQTLAGVRRVVAVLGEQCPRATILLVDIFPRGERMNAMRGDIAQINQALTRLDDGTHVRFVRVGDRFVEDDGSIRAETMPDFLHLTESGYRTWADAIVPELTRVLSQPSAK